MNTVSIPYAYKKKEKDKQKEKETKNQNQKKNQKSAASSKSRVLKERRSVSLCAIGLRNEGAFSLGEPGEARKRQQPTVTVQSRSYEIGRCKRVNPTGLRNDSFTKALKTTH